MRVSFPDTTESFTTRAIIEDGNEGLVRLHQDIFDVAPNKLLLELKGFYDFFIAMSFVAAGLLIVSLFPTATLANTLISLFMVIFVVICGALATRINQLLGKKIRANDGGIFDSVVAENVETKPMDEKQYMEMIWNASRFARDEETIVYYFSHKPPENENWRKRVIKFGFLSDDKRVLFRLKYL